MSKFSQRIARFQSGKDAPDDSSGNDDGSLDCAATPLVFVSALATIIRQTKADFAEETRVFSIAPGRSKKIVEMDLAAC